MCEDKSYRGTPVRLATSVRFFSAVWKRPVWSAARDLSVSTTHSQCCHRWDRLDVFLAVQARSMSSSFSNCFMSSTNIALTSSISAPGSLCSARRSTLIVSTHAGA